MHDLCRRDVVHMVSVFAGRCATNQRLLCVLQRIESVHSPNGDKVYNVNWPAAKAPQEAESEAESDSLSQEKLLGQLPSPEQSTSNALVRAGVLACGMVKSVSGHMAACLWQTNTAQAAAVLPRLSATGSPSSGMMCYSQPQVLPCFATSQHQHYCTELSVMPQPSLCSAWLPSLPLLSLKSTQTVCKPMTYCWPPP